MVYDVLAQRLNLQRHREPRGTKLQSLHLLSSVRARVVLLYDHIDRLCWNLDTTGDYTIKSGCIIIDKIIFLGVSPAASLFWKGLVPLKIEVFLWKLMSDKLCARKFLAYKHIISHQQAICPICEYETESFSHLSLYCLEP
jgi:hypothetical protein